MKLVECELIAIRQIYMTNEFMIHCKYIKGKRVEYWTFNVDDFYPYFFIRQKDYRFFTTLLSKVQQLYEYISNVQHDSGFTDWYEDEVIKIETVLPHQVRMFRELLWGKSPKRSPEWARLKRTNPLRKVAKEETPMVFQADVPYERAFMTAKGINRHFTVPASVVGTKRVPHHVINGCRYISEFDNFPVPIVGGDIEVTSPEGEFPTPDEAKHPIVSCSLGYMKDWDDFPDEVITLTTLPAPIKESKTWRHKAFGDIAIPAIRVPSEVSLIRAIDRYIIDHKAEVCIWWNAWFDVRYILKRCEVLRIPAPQGILYMCQTLDAMEAYKDTLSMEFRTKLKEAHLRVQQFKPEFADLLPTVSQKYLEFRRGQRGDDINDMVKRKSWRELVFYNSSDVIDMLALKDAGGYRSFYHTWRSLGLAKTDDALMHATKLDSAILIFSNANKVVLPSGIASTQKDDSVGAHVFPPTQGEIHEDVVVIDFSRYYASIIVSEVISPEFVDPNADKSKFKKLFKKLPDGRELDTPDFLLPAFCRYLVEGRDIEEDLMKSAEIPEIRAMHKQKAATYKTLTSGLWGFLAYKKSRIYRPWAKELVLRTSRFFMKNLGNLLEKRGYKVVYGDSVTGDTPILVREVETKHVCIREIRSLGNARDWEVWTDGGWTRIKHVIKHKTEKKIFRVLTHTGCVDVTEDHSLLRPDGEKISPLNISVGEELLHSFPQEFDDDTESEISEDLAWCYGFFMADGTCRFYDYGKGKQQYQWSIQKNQKSLEIALPIFERAEEKTFNIRKAGLSYRLTMLGNGRGVSRDMVLKYRSLFYTKDGLKKVPDVILRSAIEIRRAFFEGYYFGDGCKTNEPRRRSSIKGKIGAMGLYYVATSIGHTISINDFPKNSHVYSLNYGTTHLRKPESIIKKIIELGSESREVYDLETENHHFHAGVGQMMVHNTDSVFVKRPDGTELDPYQMAEDVNEIMRKLCHYKKYDIMIEAKPEKIGKFTIFFEKKTYSMYLVWEDPKIDVDTWEGTREELIQQGDRKEPRVLVKGLSAIRSDSTRFSSKFQIDLIHFIFKKSEEGLSIPEIMSEVNTQIRVSGTEIDEMISSGLPSDLELLAKPQSFKKGLDEYGKSTYKYIIEGAHEWNRKFPDDLIEAGSKAFYLPIQGGKYLVFLDGERIATEDLPYIDRKRVRSMNIVDRAFTVLEHFRYPKKYIEQVALGDKTAEIRTRV